MKTVRTAHRAVLGRVGHASVPTDQMSKLLRPQSTSLDDAFQRSNWNGFGPVKRHDHLPPFGIPPLLMAARLVDFMKSVLTKHPRHFLGVANRKPATHAAETANTLARPGNLIFEGLNQRARAWRAFRTASRSESPAEAQPGISGNTADQRPVSRSSSTTSRNFISTN